MRRRMKPLLFILSVAILFLACGWSWSKLPRNATLFVPTWTTSYHIYGQPHALWLDEYKQVGDNQPILTRALKAAAKGHEIPEFVVYTIPMRDLGQASEGGFATYEDYLADNKINAQWIERFVNSTGLHPVIYLEPDGLSLAVQYRRDQADSLESKAIYDKRIEVIRALIAMYHQAGAKVYLDAGHSGWFDYGAEDLQRIANALNDAGIDQADGLATNISNRQPVASDKPKPHGEAHYLANLIPLLKQPKPNRPLDVRVDTSRDGGPTQARQYYLAPNGWLIDNETPQGRQVGRWETDSHGEIRFYPFFGKTRTLSRLTQKEKYTYNSRKNILLAPPWLDAVGDVQLGPAPTDNVPSPINREIQHYRYIKPPDDCDGVLNCPPGASKQDTNLNTQQRQPGETLPLPVGGWIRQAKAN